MNYRDMTDEEMLVWGAVESAARIEDTVSGATPGPWRWEINEKHKHIHLVGGKPQFDLTILEPVRWGMGNATFHLRDTSIDGMNLLHRVHERRDWIAPFPGRSHHASWCADVTHPDMRLIAAAPELLAALTALVERNFTFFDGGMVGSDRKITRDEVVAARAAIRKATGASQ